MAQKVLGDFVFDTETQSMEEILKNHTGYITKSNKALFQKEYDDKLATEKAKWDLSRQNERFADSISNESNRKIVLKMLNTGTTIEEIKKDFSQLLPEATPVQEIKPTANTNLKDILMFAQGQNGTEMEALLNKNPKDLTDDELLTRAKYNANLRQKETK